MVTYRIGISAASSQITKFGQNHGVNIKLDYQGGQNFYNYVVKQQSKLSVIHVDHAAPPWGIWAWQGFKQFMKGLLDSVGADWNSKGEVCKVYVTLNTITGLDQTYRGAFEDFLWAIGPARKGLLGLGFRGEYMSWGEQTPPTTYAGMMAVFQPLIDLAHKYGYKFGSTGLGGWLQDSLSQADADRVVESLDWFVKDIWIRYRKGINDQANLVGIQSDFEGQLLSLPSNTKVIGVYAYLENTAIGAEDGVAPWYLVPDTFEYLFRALDNVYAQRPELLQYGVVVPFSHYTYNDMPGWTGHSSIMEWLFSNPNLIDLHNIRTSDYPTARETYPTITVQNPFPPYPTSVFAGAPHPPPPFAVKPGQAFPMSAYAIRLLDGAGLIGETVGFYAKDPLGTEYFMGSLVATKPWINEELKPNCAIPLTSVYGRYSVYAKYVGGGQYLPSSGGALWEPQLLVSESHYTKLDVIDRATGQHLPIENGDLQEEAYTEIVLWLLGPKEEESAITGMGDQGVGPKAEGYLPYKAPNAYPDSPLPVTFSFKILFPSPVSIGGKVYTLIRVHDNFGKEYAIVPNLLAGNREYGHMPGILYLADAGRELYGEYTLSIAATHLLTITSNPISVVVEVNPV